MNLNSSTEHLLMLKSCDNMGNTPYWRSKPWQQWAWWM